MRRPATGLAFVLTCAVLSAPLGARNESLWSAARDGNLEGVQVALAGGAEVDAKTGRGATALFYAAQHGHLEVVEYLATRGADVNVVAGIEVGDRTDRVSALGAAALGWHADVARALLRLGAHPPQYLVQNHNLLPFTLAGVERQRDWEVVNTILRTPEVEAITRTIVQRDAPGTYRTHDGREYAVHVEQETLRLTAADGSVLRFRSAGGKAFMQTLPRDPERSPPAERRTRTDQEVTMLTRFLQRVSPEERDELVQQFVERGGIWLDFIIGEGQLLGFEVREGGPARLGGAPLFFRKAGIRPAVASLLEREIASRRAVAQPMNWPSFRGPGASGIADGQFPPISWDAEKSINVRWKTPIPGLGISSPVVWEDKIFITTAISSQLNPEFRPGGVRGDNLSSDRSGHIWKIVCLDKWTGTVLWERTAHTGVPKVGRHLKSTFATPTPATDGQRVVVSFGAEGLYAYDLEGSFLWKKDLGLVGHSDYGFASSPIIYRTMVIVQSDTNAAGKPASSSSFIAAFDLADGSERWRATRAEDGSSSFGTPAIYEGPGRPQVITNGTERIRAYDPMTGTELWSLSARAGIVTPTPIVGHDLIFVTSGDAGFQPIYAIRPTAAGDITLKEGEAANEFIQWSLKRGGAFTPTPIVYGEYLYSVNVSGILGCYDVKTGRRVYLTRLRHMGGGFSSSPVAADGRLYFASEDGDVSVVNAGPAFELLATNPMGEVILATPAVSGGLIFIRTLHHVFGIG